MFPRGHAQGFSQISGKHGAQVFITGGEHNIGGGGKTRGGEPGFFSKTGERKHLGGTTPCGGDTRAGFSPKKRGGDLAPHNLSLART